MMYFYKFSSYDPSGDHSADIELCHTEQFDPELFKIFCYDATADVLKNVNRDSKMWWGNIFDDVLKRLQDRYGFKVITFEAEFCYSEGCNVMSSTRTTGFGKFVEKTGEDKAFYDYLLKRKEKDGDWLIDRPGSNCV